MSAISKYDAIRLQHMLDAARKALRFVQGLDLIDLETDEMRALAVVRLLGIVGEAANRISEEVREDNPQIPWQQIIGARNRLIHGYFDVDLDIVWVILQDDLPELVTELEQILADRDDLPAG